MGQTHAKTSTLLAPIRGGRECEFGQPPLCLSFADAAQRGKRCQLSRPRPNRTAFPLVDRLRANADQFAEVCLREIQVFPLRAKARGEAAPQEERAHARRESPPLKCRKPDLISQPL